MTGISELYGAVVGQEAAVAILSAAEGHETHAWLLVGPPGTGTRRAARALAAGIVARDAESTDRDRHIALVAAEKHPDLIVHEPEGRTFRREDASAIIGAAFRSPTEAERKVVVATNLHAAEPAALASLLKTVEEPPESTVFVLLADEVIPEMVTIASRCVVVEFGPIPAGLIFDTLRSEGIDPATAERAAAAAGGDLDRARLLATDANLAARAELWGGLPGRLDGTGATVHAVAREIRTAIDASLEPLTTVHEQQRAEVDELAERYGERGSGRRRLDEAHKREVRKARTDELRFGLATVARVYRSALESDARPALLSEAVRTVHAAGEDLLFNPNEGLWLEGLLLRLPAVPA